MISTMRMQSKQSALVYWHQSSRLQKLLFVSGTLLFISMVVHGIVLVATGGSMHGPTSFRKAMTFAETGWLLCWSVGWLLPLITMRRWEQSLVGGSVLVFGVGETILMSTQVWRGVPSHYNTTTPFDTALFMSTGVIAAVFASAMIVLLVAALRERRLAPSLLLSIRAGTLLLLFGLIIGFIMIMNSSGVWQGTAHLLATSFDFDVHTGEVGGDLVLLHAIGVHGLNLVPLAAWLLTYSRLDERARTLVTALVTANIVGISLVLGVQIFNAAPLVGIDMIKLVVLIVCGSTLFASYAAVGWWALRGIHAASSTDVRLDRIMNNQQGEWV